MNLTTLLSSFKKYFYQIFFFSFIINFLMLTTTFYMLAVYDVIMPAKGKETLIFITTLVLFFFIVLGSLEIIRSKMLNYIAENIDIQINEIVYKSSFKKAIEGEVNNEILDDLNNIKSFFSTPIISLLDSPWFILYMIVIFIFNFWLGIYGLIISFLIIVFSFLHHKKTKLFYMNSFELKRKSENFFINQLRNAEVVQALGMQENLFKRWKSLYDKYVKSITNAKNKSNLYFNISKNIKLVGSSLAYGVGALLVINGEISGGMIIVSAVLISRSLLPITQLTSNYQLIINAKKSFDKLNKILESHKLENKISLPSIKGKVDIYKLILKPPKSNQIVLKNINMSINPGEVIAIIGPSGSGKSSLVKAILNIWKPISGEIRIDNALISQYDFEKIGKEIGYVPQDIELFEGSIAENISRFDENAKDEKIIEAAKLCGAHDMIVSLKNGYNTYITPTSLSGGQRQKIAIARAVYNNPKLIILDEPNSNLDETGNKDLIEMIKKLKGHSTVIIISHQLNILSVTDKIAILKDGELTLFDETRKVMATYMNRIKK